MRSILLYQDYVHNTSAIWQTLINRFGTVSVVPINSDELIAKEIDVAKYGAFVMPGGASRYVSAKLNGIGNSNIRKYVTQGGLYIGICAGAYYACKRTEWNHGKEHFFIENELGFFSGVARGPIQEFSHGDNYTTAVAKIVDANKEKYNCLYWGGPIFESTRPAEFEVLATYLDVENNPPAVVTGLIGKGRYVLFSPHLEIDSKQIGLMHMDSQIPFNARADISALFDFSNIKSDFFYMILNRYLALYE